MDAKEKIRSRILVERRSLDLDFVREASLKAQKLLLSMEEFRLAERIGLYAPFDNELDTQELFRRATTLRKSAFFPAVVPTTHALKFYRVREWSDLAPGFGGILEPSNHLNALKDPNDLQMILVPGIAFDKKGFRLGFGKGYYDRLLAGYRGKRIGIAYEFQMVESLPVGPHDQKVDWVVTEERVIRVV